MRGQLLQINEENAELIPFEKGEALLADRNNRTIPLLWMHLEHASPEEWGNLLTTLKLRDEDKTYAMQTRHFPQAAELAVGGLVLRMPLRISRNGVKKEDRLRYLTVIMLPQLLISRIQGQTSLLKRAGNRLLEDEQPAITSSAELLLYLLEIILETEVNHLLLARNGVAHLAAAAENDIDRLDNRKLARFHRRVSILAGQAEEKLFCLTLLASLLARGKAFDSMRPGITEQVDAHKHLLRSLERVQDRISELMRLTDSRSRQQTEQRLRVLTIISGIFMPLTFITGLYGMNFPSMPFLENRWGFWLVVCSMLGLGAGLITFFRKRGWFD